MIFSELLMTFSALNISFRKSPDSTQAIFLLLQGLDDAEGGRWNLNFIIFCHGPTLASLSGQDTPPAPAPGPPDLLSLQQFAASSSSSLPCRPHHVAVSWPHAGLTAALQSVHVYTPWPVKQDYAQQGRVMEEHEGPRSCFVEVVTAHLGSGPAAEGRWVIPGRR